jgi:hypothetical protein
MKRFLIVMLNPFLLSLWVTLIILLVFPVKISKYRARITEQGSYVNDINILYDDLDMDGNSEKIAIFHNSLGGAGLTVSNVHGVLDQWSLKGRYNFFKVAGIVQTGDYNKDGQKEIYAFTIVHDSILLHCIMNYKSEQQSVLTRFVTRVGTRDDKTDPFVFSAAMDDLNGDGWQELIFGVGTGYSLHPRNVFAYDLIRDTFLVSPRSGYFIGQIIQEDIDGDGKKEILPYGYAASNVHDSAMPYPDWNSWLMVLNRKLEFVFAPVSFPGQYSNVKPLIIRDRSGKLLLAAIYQPPERHGDSCSLFAFDRHGNITRRRKVAPDISSALVLKDKRGRDFILLSGKGTNFRFYDTSFKMLKEVPGASSSELIPMDVDQDGYVEILASDIQHGKVTIYRNTLDHPVELGFMGYGEMGITYSLKIQKGVTPELYIQLGSKYALYTYGRNDLYNFRFLLYLSVYLSVLLFALLVGKIQRDQIHKRQETERKITDLQLQIVRNQLDPHFIMNATNSILASITREEKEEANKQLLHFSRLHRSLLLSSDKIQRSLREEIAFTEDYLVLEKYRFKDRFNHQFLIDPMVNLDIQVPKMILQIHVENAIKHGILPLNTKGMLSISAFLREGNLIMQIADNGAGRKFAGSRNSDSTGKGLAVMEQYSLLFNKVHHGKLYTTIEDITDDSGKAGGTRVTITLTALYEEQ